MGYTKFGKIIRKEMIDHDENLMTVAELLGVTTSFVSAVLTGTKSAPDSWIEKLSGHYGLRGEKYDEFYDAYCEDKKNVRINIENSSIEQKKLVLQFQRKLPELNEEEIHTIFEILGEEK